MARQYYRPRLDIEASFAVLDTCQKKTTADAGSTLRSHPFIAAPLALERSGLGRSSVTLLRGAGERGDTHKPEKIPANAFDLNTSGPSSRSTAGFGLQCTTVSLLVV